MLIHVQAQKTTSSQYLKFQLPTEWGKTTYNISKNKICCALQMLQEHECTNILDDQKCSVVITNHGRNVYLITCQAGSNALQVICQKESCESQIPPCMHSLVAYMNQQMLPLHSDCIKISSRMQSTFGHFTYINKVKPSACKSTDNNIAFHSNGIEDTFFRNNATTVSKLTDIFNMNASGKSMFTSSYTARMLQIAAIFCATADGKQTALLHVGQSMMSDMTQDMIASLYAQEPERHHVTLLLKGDTREHRISRINLAIRIISPEHPFVAEHLRTVMGLNASMPQNSIVILTGVNKDIAAAIYMNSQMQRSAQHKLALHSYMC